MQASMTQGQHLHSSRSLISGRSRSPEKANLQQTSNLQQGSLQSYGLGAGPSVQRELNFINESKQGDPASGQNGGQGIL